MQHYEFTADDADIILRASRCNVTREFRVHKTLLSIASPVFKDMFSIPQPVSSTTPTEAPIPVIDVHDSPEDLEVFLRIIYPLGLPPIPTLDAISSALVILDKYQVQSGLLQPLRSLLVSPKFLKNDPIKVYSLACYWKFEEEADLAASYASTLDVLAHARQEDIQRLTSTEYHRILTLGKVQQHVSDVPVARAGVPNDKQYYAAHRDKVLLNFGGIFSVFYQYEMTVEWTLGHSRLGRFIHALVEKLHYIPRER